MSLVNSKPHTLIKEPIKITGFFSPTTIPSGSYVYGEDNKLNHLVEDIESNGFRCYYQDLDEILDYIEPLFLPSEYCDYVIIDGVPVGAIDTYTFTSGRHTIEYVMKDYTRISDFHFTNFGLLGLESVEIPEGVTEIGYGAFTHCLFTSITIPEGVTSIGANAFSECSNLKTINIPEKVTSIGPGAFYGCSSLAEVTYKGKTYTSKQEVLNVLKSNGVETGRAIFDSTGLGV